MLTLLLTTITIILDIDTNVNHNSYIWFAKIGLIGLGSGHLVPSPFG